jgi:hypothetical protein
MAMKPTTRLTIFVLLVTLASLGFSLLLTQTRLHYLTDGLKGVPRPEVEDFWRRQVPLAFGVGSLAIVVILGLLRSNRRSEALAWSGLGIVGLALLLSSMAVLESTRDSSPGVVGVDWIPHAPSFLLVRLIESPNRPGTQWRSVSGMRVPVSPERTVQQQAIYEEVLLRHQTHRLSRANRAALAHRQFAETPPFTIETRARWPEGVPVRVTVSGQFAGLMPRELTAIPDFPGGRSVVAYQGGVEQRRELARGEPAWYDRVAYAPGQQSIGVPPTGRRIVFRTSIAEAGETIWRGDVVHDIVVNGSMDEVLRAVETPELLASMTDAVSASLRLNDACSRIAFTCPSDPKTSELTMAVVVEFLDGETVVATATLRCRPSLAAAQPVRWTHGNRIEIPDDLSIDRSRETWADLSGDLATLCAADPVDPEWRVRVRGDGGTALDDYDATAYWSGSLVVPLELVAQERSL